MPYKPVFLFLFFTCFASLILGQNAARVLQKASQQFKSGKYCEVIKILEKPPQLSSDSLGLAMQLLKTESFLMLEDWKSMRATFEAVDAKITNSRSKAMHTRFKVLKARILTKQEKFEQAKKLFEQVLANLSESVAKEDKTYARTLAHYGLSLLQMEAFGEAEKAIQNALQLLPNDEPIKGICHTALANLFQHLSQNAFAEESFSRSKSLWEKQGWLLHPGYAVLLNDFSLFYFQNNDPVRGEELLALSESITQKICSPPSNTGYNVGARATLNYLLGDLEEASKLYGQVKSIFEKLGQNKEVAIALNQLGRIHLELWDLPAAAEQFRLGLQHAALLYGQDKPGLIKAFLLDGLATVNDYDDQFDKADSLYLEEQAILKVVTGKNNIHYSNAINNQAYFYEYYQEQEKAAALYQESLTIAGDIYGKKHPSYLTTLYNLARIYASMDSVALATEYYQNANALQLELLSNYFTSFDEQILLEYRLQALGNFDAFFNYACFSPTPALNTELQNISLATKNLVLDYATKTRALASSFGPGEAKTLEQSWIDTRKQLSKAYSWGVVEKSRYQGLVDSLEQRSQAYERALIRKSPEKFNRRRQLVSTDLRERIRPGEATVDFLTFRHHAEDGTSTKDSLLYFALLNKSDTPHPELIYLTDNKALESVFQSYTHYTQNLTASHQLYNLIWKPLEPFLTDVSTVHVSPDGLLYQLSFGALITDPSREENTLLDQYEIHYYTNLRDFIQGKNRRHRWNSALLVGTPSFDSSETKSQKENRTTKQGLSRNLGGYFAPLEGAGQELAYVKNHLEKKKRNLKILAGEAATEHQIKQYLSSSAVDILHLSTHGYFIKEDTAIQEAISYEDKLKTTKNPLLRTGLALTGANATWSSQRQISFEEDGLLSAQEVTDLDLSKTKLVVLSACETGLGKVQDGEGVFGLQRSFKLVGADYLVMSLWKIPDSQTAELMDHFYRFLLKKNHPQKALRKAQLKMKKDYPPYYWAGFVLIQ